MLRKIFLIAHEMGADFIGWQFDSAHAPEPLYEGKIYIGGHIMAKKTSEISAVAEKKSFAVSEKTVAEWREELKGLLQVTTKAGALRDAEIGNIYADGSCTLRVPTDRTYNGQPWPLKPSARVKADADFGDFCKKKSAKILKFRKYCESLALAYKAEPEESKEVKESAPKQAQVLMHERKTEDSADIKELLETVKSLQSAVITLQDTVKYLLAKELKK